MRRVIGTAPSTAGTAASAIAVSAAATVAARAGAYAAITPAATVLPAVNRNWRRFGCLDAGNRSSFSIGRPHSGSPELLFRGSSFGFTYSSPRGPTPVNCATYSPDLAQRGYTCFPWNELAL